MKTTDELLKEADDILKEIKVICLKMDADAARFEAQVNQLAQHPFFKKPEYKEES